MTTLTATYISQPAVFRDGSYKYSIHGAFLDASIAVYAAVIDAEWTASSEPLTVVWTPDGAGSGTWTPDSPLDVTWTEEYL